MPAPTMPGNPHKKGSAQWKLWNRREHDKKIAADKAAAEAAPPSGEGSTSVKGRARDRRKGIDDVIADAVGVNRDNQSTDSNQ